MAWIVSAVVAAVGYGIAIFPEQDAKLLTSPDGWSPVAYPSSRVRAEQFPPQYRQLRRSEIASPGGELFRSWTPDFGVVPMSISSSSFYPSRLMSFPVTGTTRTPDGGVRVDMRCDANGRRLEIFRGSVNVNVSEAIVAAPRDWCLGTAKIELASSEKNNNVGVGDAFAISRLSYLKTTFIGLLPYLLTALGIFAFVMLSGAAIAFRAFGSGPALPFAFCGLGIAALTAFYLENLVPTNWKWVGSIAIVLGALAGIMRAGPTARHEAISQLRMYAKVWVLFSFGYFTILSLGYNGLGHWEPNYRFWPATWSSDNELPWLFAEAIRHGWNLKGLFGGGWIPTDRPPLMAGAHLLIGDAFELLQTNNDGSYLRGRAYNAAAVALNSLWVPAVWWLLASFNRALDAKSRKAVLLFVGAIPFVLFNSIYGWPKAFGAAFALIAFGLAWQSREQEPLAENRMKILLCLTLAAFSMLAHESTALFLAPLGLCLVSWNLRNNVRALFIGSGIAAAIMFSWMIYKLVVLPSADPLTKYALSGDYSFHDPNRSLWSLIAERYGQLGIFGWLEAKGIMLLQAFLPLHHPVAQIGLNADGGSDAIDKLRAWDFMLLSKGNCLIPLFTLMTAWVWLQDAEMEESKGHTLRPFLVLVAISSMGWLIAVLGFLVPPVLITWPQAAIFGLAVGGAAVARARYRWLFNVAALAMIAYTSVVWILAPLRNALVVDTGAALALAAFIASLEVFGYRKAFGGDAEAGVRFDVHTLVPNRTIDTVGRYAVYATAAGALLFCTYIALRYLHQPLADVHAFRQTQTALTSFWMLKDGWRLAYETPVIGYPWSVPFEFPIYQTLVAVFVAVTGLELEPAGRLVSYLFLVACAWPAFEVAKRLDLPKSVPWVFCSLLWTAPLYVYWGRTFMIETAALFFSLACLPYALDILNNRLGIRAIVAFLAFATAAVLQKATTGGPVLLFVFVAGFFIQLRKTRSGRRDFSNLLKPLVLICLPVLIGLVWTHYTDVVKSANPFGVQLTSSALGKWNFGTIAQRLDPETWRRVIWNRSFTWNAAGAVGLILLMLPWMARPQYRRLGRLSLGAFGMFLLPVMIFTNVHFVHEYYQVANVAFLLGALAIIIGGWLPLATGTMAFVPLVTAVIIFSNVEVFENAYGIVAARDLDQLDPRSVQSYKVGRYLRDVTVPGTGLAVFGNGYSSEIAFQAERKTVAAPPWFKGYQDLWVNPQKFLGDTVLGAIVICPDSNSFPAIKGFPDADDLQKKLAGEPGWIHRSVYGCELLLSRKAMEKDQGE